MSSVDLSAGDGAVAAAYLDAFRVAFNPVWKQNNSDLDRCITFFELVTNTRVAIILPGDADIAAEFQRDLETFDQLDSLESMQDVLQGWVNRFSKMVDARTNSRDTDTADNRSEMSVEVSNADGGKIELETGPKISGVKRPHEATEEDAAWKKKRDVRRTRGMTSRQEAMQQPIHYAEASIITGHNDFLTLKNMVQKELKKYVEQQDDYWEPFKPDPELWRGCSDKTREHVEALKIPTVPLQETLLPDMMLHCLGRLDQSPDGGNIPALDPAITERIARILSAGDWDYFLKNAAGVGKTRLLFELLVQRFGIYLNFAHDKKKNPYGSRDAMTARRVLEYGDRNIHGSTIVFQGDIAADGRTSSEVVLARKNNEAIVAHLYSLLVYSRVLVFDWLLTAYQKLHGTIDAAATRLWCLLQIRPLLWDSKKRLHIDVFDTVFQAILAVEHESSIRATGSLLEKWYTSKYEIAMRFIVLDEAHVPAAEFPLGFNPVNASKMGSRPLLKPVLHAVRAPFADYPTRVLVAATSFNEAVIEDAIGSSTLKPSGKPAVPFTDFGDYSDPSTIDNVLLHFFGRRFVSKLRAVMRSHIMFWLAGRRRFLSTFIQWSLRQGVNHDNLHRVLGQLVDGATGKKYFGEYDEIPGFSFSMIVPARLRADLIESSLLDTMRRLQDAVVGFIIKGRFPNYGSDMRDLVTLGLGCFVPPRLSGGQEIVTIRESLTLASLMAWVNKKGEAPLTRFLDNAMSTNNPKTRGYAFEDIIMYALWQAFSAKNGARLDKVFEFRFLSPTWKDKRAELVQIFKRSSPNGRSHTMTAGVTTRIGYQALSPEETQAWFSDSDHRRARIPFLQPDERCGPDLIFVLLLPDDTELLVCVQCKCWSTVHRKGAIWTALKKLTPEGFYSDKTGRTTLNEPERLSLVAQLEQFKAADANFMPEAKPKAEYNLLRVLATFDDVVAWPKEMDSTYGSYPVASLSRSFMESATLTFSALERAYEMAKQNAIKNPDSLDVIG